MSRGRNETNLHLKKREDSKLHLECTTQMWAIKRLLLFTMAIYNFWWLLVENKKKSSKTNNYLYFIKVKSNLFFCCFLVHHVFITSQQHFRPSITNRTCPYFHPRVEKSRNTVAGVSCPGHFVNAWWVVIVLKKGERRHKLWKTLQVL